MVALRNDVSDKKPVPCPGHLSIERHFMELVDCISSTRKEACPNGAEE